MNVAVNFHFFCSSISPHSRYCYGIRVPARRSGSRAEKTKRLQTVEWISEWNEPEQYTVT